jgi:hypothetical protein
MGHVGLIFWDNKECELSAGGEPAGMVPAARGEVRDRI